MSYLRKTLDIAINGIGKITSNRKVAPPIDQRDGYVKVNLGCGLRVARGWLNIDGSLNALFASCPDWIHKILFRISGSRDYYSRQEYCSILSDHDFLCHDLSLSLPLHDSSVDFIYSSHFFEHLFKDEAFNLMEHCLRVLKPGGVIRISIPDLSYAVSLYTSGKKKEMLEDYFFVSGKGSYLARHKYMYDFELISEALQQAGFSEIHRCEYRQGRVPDIDVLDVYPDVSLFVEAVKP